MKTMTLEGRIDEHGQLTADSIEELRANAVRQAARLPLEKRAAALEAFEKMIEQTRSQGLLCASAGSIVDALERAKALLDGLPRGLRELARALDALHEGGTAASVYSLGCIAAQLSMALTVVDASKCDLKELIAERVFDSPGPAPESANTPS